MPDVPLSNLQVISRLSPRNCTKGREMALVNSPERLAVDGGSIHVLSAGQFSWEQVRLPLLVNID